MSNEQQKRRTVLATLGALGLGAAATVAFRRPTSLETALDRLADLPDADPMPAVFVGHGTPLSAIDPNVWTMQWAEIGRTLPRPQAILSISAHWLTEGASLVTAATAPPMNYDVRGFPKEVYDYRYAAPGSPAAARDVVEALKDHVPVFGDTEWGFDHGTWLVLKYMYPKADIPVLQLSIDFSRPPAFHYELGKRLRGLRSKGILVLGSGNVVPTSASAEERVSPNGRATGLSSSISAWLPQLRTAITHRRSTSSPSASSRSRRIRHTTTSCRCCTASDWQATAKRFAVSTKAFSGLGSACDRSC